MQVYEWGLAFTLLLEEKGVKRGQGARSDKVTSATIAEVTGKLGVSPRTARHRAAQADAFEALSPAEQEAVRERRDAGEEFLRHRDG